MGVFVLFRFVAGLGLGGEGAVGATLVSEVVPVGRRAAAGVVLFTASPIGMSMGATVNLLIAGVSARLPVRARSSSSSSFSHLALEEVQESGSLFLLCHCLWVKGWVGYIKVKAGQLCFIMLDMHLMLKVKVYSKSQCHHHEK